MAESRTEMEQKIIGKAMKDDAFRNKLTGNPKETIEESLGVKLPDNLNVHINEEGPKDIYIYLPVKAEELQDGELSGEQPSGVSRGWGLGMYTLSGDM